MSRTKLLCTHSAVKASGADRVMTGFFTRKANEQLTGLPSTIGVHFMVGCRDVLHWYDVILNTVWFISGCLHFHPKSFVSIPSTASTCLIETWVR